MRIAFISGWFSERMGYAENCLPKAMVSLGHDVHLICGNVQPYFDSPTSRQTYEPFIGPPVVPCGTTTVDGVTLYRLPHEVTLGRLRIRGLVAKLRQLRPRIVQTFDVAALSTYEAATARPFLGYKLFLETHFHASVFPDRLPAWQLASAWMLGRLASTCAERCYAISPDAADLAVRRLGVQQRKVRLCPLGVDTQLFHPPADDERFAFRKELGIREGEILCIYTGRFAPDKGPRILADAIDGLVVAGKPFRGLFVGNGTAAESTEISTKRGCLVRPFVPATQLPLFYGASDIGVWPKQESTSQLDAAACGLPIVVSDRVHVTERVAGNGLTYREGDAADLARQLVSLESHEVRHHLGLAGSRKMRERFSWAAIAAQRVKEYEEFL